MGERVLTLNEQIESLLAVAVRPLSAADIRRRLPGDVQPDEVGSRLAKMKKRGRVVCVEMPSQAVTGPRTIKGWVSPENPIAMEHVPDIAETPEKREISSGEVASAQSATSQQAA